MVQIKSYDLSLVSGKTAVQSGGAKSARLRSQHFGRKEVVWINSRTSAFRSVIIIINNVYNTFIYIYEYLSTLYYKIIYKHYLTCWTFRSSNNRNLHPQSNYETKWPNGDGTQPDSSKISAEVFLDPFWTWPKSGYSIATPSHSWESCSPVKWQ